MYKKPVNGGYISSEYGQRTRKKITEFHFGIDINGILPDKKYGIYLPCEGHVIKAGYSESYGYRIWTKCTNGPYKGLYLILAHMEEIETFNEGEHLIEGEYIGMMGNTGFSQGRHLHLGLKKYIDIHECDGNSINPKIIREMYQ